MKTTFKLIAWLLCFILALDVSFSLMNESSTLANCIGCFLLLNIGLSVFVVKNDFTNDY